MQNNRAPGVRSIELQNALDKFRGITRVVIPISPKCYQPTDILRARKVLDNLLSTSDAMDRNRIISIKEVPTDVEEL